VAGTVMGLVSPLIELVQLAGDKTHISGRVKFTPGGRLDSGFGYHLTDSVGGNGGGGDGLGFYQLPVLANVVFRLPTRSRFKPFIGAGVGGVLTRLDDGNLFHTHSDEDFGFAGQGFAGVRYQLSSKVELGLIYKCLGTTKRFFDSFGVRMEGSQTQSLSASVSVKF
jgi:opacity protein-like surface antigen